MYSPRPASPARRPRPSAALTPPEAAHRNRIENNRFVDNGQEKGFAVDVQGATELIVLVGNEIVETRGPAQRTAIRLGPETRAITVKGNRIQGFAKELEAP